MDGKADRVRPWRQQMPAWGDRQLPRHRRYDAPAGCNRGRQRMGTSAVAQGPACHGPGRTVGHCLLLQARVFRRGGTLLAASAQEPWPPWGKSLPVVAVSPCCSQPATRVRARVPWCRGGTLLAASAQEPCVPRGPVCSPWLPVGPVCSLQWWLHCQASQRWGFGISHPSLTVRASVFRAGPCVSAGATAP